MSDTRVPPGKVDIPEVLEKPQTNVDVDTEPSTAPPLRTIPGGRKADSTPKRPRRQTQTKTGPTGAPKLPGDELPYTPGVVAQGMHKFYAQIGMFAGAMNPRIGETLITNAENMAKSCERVAKESPAARKVFDSLITSSAWGEFVSAHLPVAAVVAMEYIPAVRRKFNPETPPKADGGNVPPMNSRTA